MKKNKQLKQKFVNFKHSLCEEFNGSTNIQSIMQRLLACVDELIIQLFKTTCYGPTQKEKAIQSALIAVGSYGRRELLLHSDIDILLLHPPNLPSPHIKQLEQFVRDCWDVGLIISHQITTVSALAALAKEDVSVISTLLDARLLCGNDSLLESLKYETHRYQMWSSQQFFEAKLAEQSRRGKKYDGSAYQLEPDIKSGPGGLRDLHTLLSITKRHYQINKLADCINVGFLTEKEYETLHQCQLVLWRIRFALHLVAGKAEERLLFDHQIDVAKRLNYQDNAHSLAIEQFMKHYFQVIKTLRELNELFLQLFKEIVVFKEKQLLTPINRDFQLANDCIEVTHPQVFSNRPKTLLEIFFIMAKNPEIKGIRAHTIRLIRQYKYLIDDKFRHLKDNNTLFIDLIKQSHNIYHQLKFMNRYGVLGRYIPEFNRIIGQMQYDLFHVYTVDQHTLFVIKNTIDFKQSTQLKQFPLYGSVASSLLKPELLVLAALFHDIAKGQGGNHSELGAKESLQFCKQHQMPDKDCQLVAWLVLHHLKMSKTIQQQDIYDPACIEAFCRTIPHSHYIDYLYCLTVADICATNSNLWNSWKASLLRELYQASKHHMEQKHLSALQVIDDRKKLAMKFLIEEGHQAASIQSLWENFKPGYFLHESAQSITRQTSAILNAEHFPLIIIMPHHGEGGTEVLLYLPHRKDRFIIATTVLNNHQVTIQEARITTCLNDYDLDTYILLDTSHKPLESANHIDLIKESLLYYFNQSSLLPSINQRRQSRQMAHFKLKPKIRFEDDEGKKHTKLFLVMSDKPGLLAQISRVLARLEIELLHAKITTAGERVEDMFVLTNQQHLQLNTQQKETLFQSLSEELRP